VLDIGALDVNGTCRDLLPSDGYIGMDIRLGQGVDLLADILNPPKVLYQGFNAVVCLETLEHVTEPWTALDNIHKCLKWGGLFIGTWCFVYEMHDQPNDYWRCTPAGFEYLLDYAGFKEIHVETEGEGPRGVFAVARK
jgi:SAM-dependent methyltransferase